MKKEEIASRIVLALVFLFFITMPLQYVFDVVTEDETFTSLPINWEEKYPFKTGGRGTEENRVDKNRETTETSWKTTAASLQRIMNQYRAGSVQMTGKIEKLPANHLFMRMKILELYGRINRALGTWILRDSEDTVLYVGEGRWLFTENAASVAESVNNVCRLHDYIRSLDMDFLVFETPSKQMRKEDTIAGVIEEHYSEDKDAFTEALREKGVDVYDIRDEMPGAYEEYMNLFFKTDHHWKPGTGLWAAGRLAEKLHEQYRLDIDLNKIAGSAFQTESLPALFLGSEGRKVTLGYCELEDFDIVTPIDPPNLHVEIPRAGVDAYGDFSLLLDSVQLRRGNPYNLSSYHAYGYGDQPMVRITNQGQQGCSRVLFLKDSFGDVVFPFFAMGCSQVDALDLRYFTGSLETYLSENRYDVIVLETNQGGSNDRIDYDKHNSLWDFQ